MNQANQQIILASKSASRRAMLDNIGLSYTAMPADIDERAIESNFSGDPSALALELASQKALFVSKSNPDTLVIGSDSLVEFEGQVLNKAETDKEALEKILMLAGNTHYLISSVAVVKDGILLWSHTQSASLTMRAFNEDFAQNYIEKIGDAAMSCVGAYQLESLGPWLFDKIDGDYFTILGMPLINLLSYLQTAHGVKL